MSRAATAHPPAAQRLAWHLSLLGYRTLDLLGFALATLGRHPAAALRSAVVASLLVLLAQPELRLTLHLGSAAAPVAPRAATATPAVARAGLLAAAPAAAEAALDDRRALALIERFEHVAAAEEERFGLDGGVLLAAAIVASPDASNANAFGPALAGDYPNAWASWRAMSLCVLAAVEGEGRRADWLAAAARLFPDREAAYDRLAYALERYSL